MAQDDIVVRRLLDGIRAVEWDEQKAAGNRRKHGIDFEDAVEVLYGTNLLSRSDRNKEERWLAIGETDGRVVAVVFTRRGDAIRVISARSARKNEKRAYHQEKMGRAPERKN